MLVALTSNPGFKERQQRHVEMLAEDLVSNLSVTIPSPGRGSQAMEFKESVRKFIIGPTAELAHRLQLGTRVCLLQRAELTADLSTCECLNLAAGFKPLAVPVGLKNGPESLFPRTVYPQGRHGEDALQTRRSRARRPRWCEHEANLHGLAER